MLIPRYRLESSFSRIDVSRDSCTSVRSFVLAVEARFGDHTGSRNMAARPKRSKDDVAAEKVESPVDSHLSGETASSTEPDGDGQPTSENTNDKSSKSKTVPIDCSVCLEQAVFPIRIPCGHVFCFLCVKGAARQSNRCPLCRQEIPIDFDKNPTLLEHQEMELFDDDYQWFYEGKNGWWLYEKRTSEEIEEYFKLGNKIFDLLICGTMYTIDLERNVQYNRENPTRKRKLKREKAINIAVKGVAGVH